MVDNIQNQTEIMPVGQTGGMSDKAILVYNSQNLSSEQLQSQFSIRLKEYQRVWMDIQQSKMIHPENHYLIQGVRGAGKTMFLSKLAQDVKDDVKLNNWLVPVLLNEEEYSIFSLFTFWLRVAQILSNTYAYFSPLYDHVNTLDLAHKDADEAQLAEIIWQQIREALQQENKKIIILMDNMAELFDSFSEIEHAQLREILSQHSEVRLIGASSVILDDHFDQLAPFYQFFKVVNLKSISQDEMHTLLKTLAKQTSQKAQEKINELIKKHPERLEAVRRLTDGVPRTITLLFQIIMEGARGNSYSYLDETIDKTTPLYKHRMDDLSRQQKPIVHAIAMNWDAVSVKEISESTRLPSKTVSAQLNQLQKQWIIEKIPTNTKNHLYAIKERFFNIWYLMRYGNTRDKQRVLWLTRFLETWCDELELENRLQELKMNNSENKLNIDYINALLSSEKIAFYKRKELCESLQTECDETNLIELGDFDVEEDFLQEIKTLIKDDASKASEYILNLLHSNNYRVISIIGFWIYNSYQNLKVILEPEFQYNPSEKFFHRLEELSVSNEFLHWFLVDSYFKFNIKEKKSYCLDWAESLKSFSLSEFVSIKVLLWNDDFKSAITRLKVTAKSLATEPYKETTQINYIQPTYLLLLAKGQTEAAYKIITQHNLEDKLKPIYYATVSLLDDERNQEYLRMGSELKPTVDEILQKVEEYKEKYA